MDRIDLTLIAAGLVFLAGAMAAPSLVRVNLVAYRLLGLEDLARSWEQRLAWWVPAVRTVSAVGTLAVAFALLLITWH
jgi:hypothetical protein